VGALIASPFSPSSADTPLAIASNQEEAMSLTLHFHPLSSFCWKVLIALYENDIPFTPNLVNLGDPAERAALQKLWGIGKFPVLRDAARNQTVPESSIIIDYLDQHYPGRIRFIPDDPEAARQTRLRDRFYDLYVHLPMQKIMGDRRRPADSKPSRRRSGAGATADRLRHDRAADVGRRLGDGRRLQPGRLRGAAGAVLRQHGGVIRR
jgi:glutathione S-transferase